MTRIAELCAGYSGLGMAVESVLGGELAWTAEIDDEASKILAHRFPLAPNYGDITTADWTSIEPPDVLCAGFPCQPISLAGKRLGEADERWIWPAVAGAVRDLRPGLVFLENVSALVVRGLAGVAADLAQIGYVGSWCCVRASDVGAPHRRERVFILARPAEDADRATGGQRRLPAPRQAEGRRPHAHAGGRGGAPAAHSGSARLEIRPVEPNRHERQAAERGSGDAAAADASVTGLAERQDARRSVPVAPGTGLRGNVGPTERGDVVRVEWGSYATAIRRWERILGRSAPCPTQPGRTAERLSPRFVEWMMGLPDGWVTRVPGLSHTAQLKALGNGVVPAQAAMALRLLLDRADIPALVAEEGAA